MPLQEALLSRAEDAGALDGELLGHLPQLDARSAAAHRLPERRKAPAGAVDEEGAEDRLAVGIHLDGPAIEAEVVDAQ